MFLVENQSSDFEKTFEKRSNTVLVCPENDPESFLINQLALKAGIEVIRSNQSHGASIDREENIIERILDSGKKNVWVVEMPGLEVEEELKNKGLFLNVIDHHVHGDLDRLRDESGEPEKSSLEQFIQMAGISENELELWGFNPKIVVGLGIHDRGFVKALKAEGYSAEEIRKVLELSETIKEKIYTDYVEQKDAAKKAWGNKEEKGGAYIVQSADKVDVRTAVSYLSVLDGADNKPLIISALDGDMIYVQNIQEKEVENLNRHVKGHTFVYGDGHCWGINNAKSEAKVPLSKIIEILGLDKS